MEENLECTRCGYRWFSEKYEGKKEIPDYCARCYRKTVRPIPGEPSILLKLVYGLKNQKKNISEFMESTKKSMILWKENNRYMIDMMVFVLALLVIFAVLYMFIFVWG